MIGSFIIPPTSTHISPLISSAPPVSHPLLTPICRSATTRSILPIRKPPQPARPRRPPPRLRHSRPPRSCYPCFLSNGTVTQGELLLAIWWALMHACVETPSGPPDPSLHTFLKIASPPFRKACIQPSSISEHAHVALLRAIAVAACSRRDPTSITKVRSHHACWWCPLPLGSYLSRPKRIPGPPSSMTRHRGTPTGS